MNPEKEAQLRIMLKREGKSHEEINRIVKQWEISEEKEQLNQMIREAQNESIIEEPETTDISESLSKIDREAEEKKQRVIEEQNRKDEETDFTESLHSKKMELLDKIENQLLEREKVLNSLIEDEQNQKNELEKLYERAQVEFVNDRVKARENYKRELESFFGKIFDTVTNFSDSPTELSLICLYNRSGTVVSLAEVLSSKRIIGKDEIKIGD